VKELMQRPTGIEALEACYGAENMRSSAMQPPAIKAVTIATELDDSQTVVQDLRSRGILVSVGHSTSTYSQMCKAVGLGATMVTHLFNAMNQPHHRESGIFGILGAASLSRPFYGIIADGVHVHPSMVTISYNAHPDGCILVTDAMAALGLPDGEYPWANGEVIEKRKGIVTLKGSGGRIAGR
jgi:N-acetylglucosamine-6-phosphate deacetylase